MLLRLLVILGLWSAPLHAQTAGAGGPTAATPNVEAVTLQPGDFVRVAIWREEELSGEFPVNEHGILTLPLVGDKQVTGIPLDQLRDEIMEAYRVHLRNPSIVVTPLRRVNVLGEVYRPGVYPVDLTVSLMDAVALAGGATPVGDLDKITVMRNGQAVREQVQAGQQLGLTNVRSGDQIIVGRRSMLEQNWMGAANVVLTAVAILVSLLR
jgi:protein involved in polysaccharide export with SLBB domain